MAPPGLAKPRLGGARAAAAGSALLLCAVALIVLAPERPSEAAAALAAVGGGAGQHTEMLKVFRFQILLVQRAWRDWLRRRHARHMLLSRAWDREVGWLRRELSRAVAEGCTGGKRRVGQTYRHR